MRERDVEQKLIRAVRRSGGLALKLVSPGFNGVPDRLLLFRDGKMAFCETKRTETNAGRTVACAHRFTALG